MKKYKLVLGAAVLAIVSIIAGRASTKYAPPTALYVTTSAGSVCLKIAAAITSATNQLTTNTAVGIAAFIRTGTTDHRLFGSTIFGNCATPLNKR